MTIAKFKPRRVFPACLIALLSMGLGSMVMPESAQACGGRVIARREGRAKDVKPETLAQAPSAISPSAISPSAISPSANSSSQNSPSKKKASYNTWQGTYDFFETAKGDATVKTRFYRISMLQVRCGWQAQVRLSGDDTPHTSVGVNVRSIGDDEIGLYYNGDKYDGRDRGQFEPGQLLLRIRLENDDTHRIFFEGIAPLVDRHRDRGLAIDPPVRHRP